MFSQWQRELIDAAQGLARRQQITAMLASLDETERQLVQHGRQLRGVLRREQADVERLSRASAAALFYTILGNRQDKLEEERRQADAVRLKYDLLLQQLEGCRAQRAQLQAEAEALADCEQRYDTVLSRICRELRGHPGHARRLCQLEKELGENQAQLKEIVEASQLGQLALESIKRVAESLRQADEWGFSNASFGERNSVFSASGETQQKAAEAAAEIPNMQLLLIRFRTELADVRLPPQPGQDQGELVFTDYLSDCTTFSWDILDGVRQSRRALQPLGSRVATILRQLAPLEAACRSEKARLEQELHQLATTASLGISDPSVSIEDYLFREMMGE